MATVLLLRCPECGSKLKVAFETPDDELPDCPVCEAAQSGASNLDFDKPVNIAFGSVTNKAVETTYKIAEEHYGLTNIRGSAGGDAKTHDIGEPAHPKLTPAQQKMADAWAGAQSGKLTLPTAGGSLMQAARAATHAERARGAPDPVAVGLKAVREHGKDDWSPRNAIKRADAAGRRIP